MGCGPSETPDDSAMECLNSLVQLARKASPFYACHFKFVERVTQLEDLPIINTDDLWAAAAEEPANILTGPQVDGFLLRTGGTTGGSKLTRYSQIDWQRTIHMFGQGFLYAGLQAGDRIANLFVAEDLYGSLLATAMSIQTLPVPAVTVPLGHRLAPSILRDRIGQCQTNVLLSSPTVLVALARYCIEHHREYTGVTAILFTGEELCDGQLLILKQAFPSASTIKPCIYASVDGGAIAHSASNGQNDHTLLKVFKDTVFMEIVTEDAEQTPIQENNVTGAIIVTNLSRQLQPVIRYPVGDRGEWVDFQQGIFRLHGRAAAKIRIGSGLIDIEDLRSLLKHFVPCVLAIQAIVRQAEPGVDELEWRMAGNPISEEIMTNEITNFVKAKSPLIADQIESGRLVPLKVRFVHMSEMYAHPASGKMQHVVDLRFDARQK